MPLIISGAVGDQAFADGSSPAAGLRQGKSGDLIVSELHGRMYEANLRGRLFHLVGSSNVALTSLNAIATGLTATATPIVGLWNPPTSLVNLVPYKAIATLTTVANTAVAPGGLMWCASSGQGGITTGTLGINGKTLVSGGTGKGFSMTQAMTGLVGSLVANRASSIGVINAAGAATAVTLTVAPQEELLEGTFIIPPGGFLGLFNQVSTTTLSYSTGLIWEEVPL